MSVSTKTRGFSAAEKPRVAPITKAAQKFPAPGKALFR
jgi:hypothetical protein